MAKQLRMNKVLTVVDAALDALLANLQSDRPSQQSISTALSLLDKYKVKIKEDALEELAKAVEATPIVEPPPVLPEETPKGDKKSEINPPDTF